MKSSNFKVPFDPQTHQEWRTRVEKELKGSKFEDFLQWKSEDGFKIEAWQDSTEYVPVNLVPLNAPWKLLNPIYAEDATVANSEALNALMNGAEAIWFEKGFLGAAALLASKNIDQSIAPIFIRSNSITDVFQDFLKNDSEPLSSPNHGLSLVNGLRMRERGATVVQEVAYTLSQGISLLNDGLSNADIYFKTGLGTSYLSEIAKTRALRMLWSNILKRSGRAFENPHNIGVNLTIDYSQADEHNNILRATSSALSGIVGGVEFMMIEPWNHAWSKDVNFSSRISRNIQNLLRDEGRLDKNLNAGDGSYFLDRMTRLIANSAWSQIQEIEKSGGFVAYTRSGKLKEELVASRKELIESFQSGNHTILGVNKYQSEYPLHETIQSRSSYCHLPEFLQLPIEAKTK